MTIIEKRAADLKARQEKGLYKLCPRCGRDALKTPLHHNALSRRYALLICDECGGSEAMLDYIGAPDTLYSWEAFQPKRPPSDFKTLAAEEVLTAVEKTQLRTLRGIYRRFLAGESAEELQLYAYEHCPGLLLLWTLPFQVKYRAKDGSVLVRFRQNEGKIEHCLDIIRD